MKRPWASRSYAGSSRSPAITSSGAVTRDLARRHTGSDLVDRPLDQAPRHRLDAGVLVVVGGHVDEGRHEVEAVVADLDEVLEVAQDLRGRSGRAAW